MARKDAYDGDPTQSRSFLLQCQLYLATLDDISSHSNVVRLLTGKAPTWANPVWEKGDLPTTNSKQFVTRFKHVFDYASEVSTHILTAKQGNRHVVDYALDFCALIVESTLNEPALKAAFYQGLNPDILTKLTRRDKASLAFLLDLALICSWIKTAMP